MTRLTRREFHTLALTATAFAALGPARRLLARRAPEISSSANLFEWKETPSGAKVAFGQGGNALLVMSRGESLLIDCKNPGLGTTLRREAESFGSPLKMVVNTHHHRDHTGGNHAFARTVPLVGHKNGRDRIVNQVEGLLGSVGGILKQLESAEPPAPRLAIDEVKAFADAIADVKAEDFAPTTLIDQRLESDKFGELEVQFHHVGPGHTDNDLIVFFPSLNLMHMGDLLFHNNWPFIDLSAGATTFGWQDSLREAIKLCDARTTVIPGHGEITDVNGLARQIEFFNKIREVVKHAKDVESMTRDEVVNLEPGAFKDYGLTQIRARTLGAVYDELAKPR